MVKQILTRQRLQRKLARPNERLRQTWSESWRACSRIASKGFERNDPSGPSYTQIYCENVLGPSYTDLERELAGLLEDGVEGLRAERAAPRRDRAERALRRMPVALQYAENASCFTICAPAPHTRVTHKSYIRAHKCYIRTHKCDIRLRAERPAPRRDRAERALRRETE